MMESSITLQGLRKAWFYCISRPMLAHNPVSVRPYDGGGPLQSDSSDSIQRRLAAILAADIVGYSRLMSVDEVGTLGALKAHRRTLIDPAIATHHGRIVKTTGDGALVEFASVVDAVGCAVVIQRGMVSRNAGVPEANRIVFRIGINIGD